MIGGERAKMKFSYLLWALALVGCDLGSPNPSQYALPEPQAYEPPSRTIYVSVNGDDALTGAKDRPWRHIQYAINHGGPSAQIYVGPGVYNERVILAGPMISGTEDQPSLLKSDGAILDGAGLAPTNGLGMVTIANASHIVITGFEIRNYETPAGFSHQGFPKGIFVHGSGEDIVISHNRIHDIRENSVCTQDDNNCSSGANGIGIYGDTVQGLRNIKVRSNEVYNNILGASESVTLNGNIDGFLVENNIVHDNNNIGFDFIGYEGDVCEACSSAFNRARNGRVRGNIARNNSIIHFGANPWYGGEDGNAAGFYVDGGHHIAFENNISTGNDLGIEIASEAPMGESADILIASNFIYNNFDIGVAIGGYSENSNGPGGGSAKRVYVINNTFYHNEGHSSEITLGYRIEDLDFINNIVVGRSQTDALFEAPDLNANHQRLNWNTNLWWADTSRNGLPLSDPNAIIAAPVFSDIEHASARVQNGSPAIDAGMTLAPIDNWFDDFWQQLYPNGQIPKNGKTDIDKKKRVHGQIDIGASEF